MSDTEIVSQADLDLLVEKIDQAELRMEPFPHLVIKNFLPDGLYEQALGSWPDDQVFATTNNFRRQQVNLRALVESLPDKIRPVWAAVLALSEVVNRALYKKFANQIALKFVPLFGANWRDFARNYSTSFRQAHLAHYSGQAGLGPHVDSVRLMVNSFLYVSENSAPEVDLGTVLYRSFGFMTPENNNKLPASVTQRLLAPDTIVPYQANCMLSFVNTPYSFHGVQDFDIGARKRRIILFSPLITASVEAIEADFKRRPLQVLA